MLCVECQVDNFKLRFAFFVIICVKWGWEYDRYCVCVDADETIPILQTPVSIIKTSLKACNSAVSRYIPTPFHTASIYELP